VSVRISKYEKHGLCHGFRILRFFRSLTPTRPTLRMTGGLPSGNVPGVMDGDLLLIHSSSWRTLSRMTTPDSVPHPSATDERWTIRIGGFSLILGALAFMAVFTFLAVRFNYPDVLDGQASDVLPALLSMGDVGRAVWAIYALLPLIWIPAAVGAFHALRRQSEGAVRAGLLFAVISAVAMMAGLMRWPSFHWELARVYVNAAPSVRPALEAVFNASNSYLGNYIGELLGELCFSIFFLLSSMAMLKRASGFPRWIGWFGIVTAVAGLIGMFRNANPIVAPIAEVNNYLLPIWMIIFGVSLVRFQQHSSSSV